MGGPSLDRRQVPAPLAGPVLAPSDDHKASHRDDDLLNDPSMGGGSHADINSALGHWADSDTGGVCRVQPPKAGPTHDAHDVEQAAKDPKVAKRLDIDWFDQGMDDGYLGSVEKEFGGIPEVKQLIDFIKTAQRGIILG